MSNDAHAQVIDEEIGLNTSKRRDGKMTRTAELLLAANRVLTAADAFVSKDGQEIICGKKEVDALVEAVIERRKVKAKKQ